MLAKERESKGCQPKQNTRTGEENFFGRYLRRLKNQNGEHLINPCESNTSARTFESKNHIKIKITRHRVMENGCIWKGASLMNVC